MDKLRHNVIIKTSSASSFKPKWPASETVPKNCCSILFSDFENLPAMKYFEGSEYDVHLLS